MGFLSDIVRDSRRRNALPGRFVEPEPPPPPTAFQVGEVPAAAESAAIATTTPCGSPVKSGAARVGFKEERTGEGGEVESNLPIAGTARPQRLDSSPSEYIAPAKLPEAVDSVAREQFRTVSGGSGDVVGSYGGSLFVAPSGFDRSSAREFPANRVSSVIGTVVETQERRQGTTSPPDLVGGGTVDGAAQAAIAGGPVSPSSSSQPVPSPSGEGAAGTVSSGKAAPAAGQAGHGMAAPAGRLLPIAAIGVSPATDPNDREPSPVSTPVASSAAGSRGVPPPPLPPGIAGEASAAVPQTGELVPPLIRLGERRGIERRAAEVPARDTHIPATEPRVRIGTIEVVVLSPAPAERTSRRHDTPMADIASRKYLRNI